MIYNTKDAKIGLVLGGGGARGAAHVGVLRVLEANNVAVDYLTGTSMGAVVGGMYAAGLSPDEIETYLNEIDWIDVFNDKPARRTITYRRKLDDRFFLIKLELGVKKSGIVFPRGFISGQKLNLLLSWYTIHTTGLKSFDDLPIPFRAIAMDIETGDEVILKDGRLGSAIRASMSIPGFFTPIELDNKTLVDGGTVNNLPINVAQDMTSDKIVAVDVRNPLKKSTEIVTLFDVVGQVTNIVGVKFTEKQIELLKESDLYIQPTFDDLTVLDFLKINEAIESGEIAAVSLTEEIRNFSVSDDEYNKFLRRHRLPRKPYVVEFIKLDNKSVVDERFIKKKIKTLPGDTLELDALNKDISKVYGQGYFEEVNFYPVVENNKKGAIIEAVGKSWSLNYLRFGFNIESVFQCTSLYNLQFLLTLTQLNRLGAELRNRLQIGQNKSLLLDYFQPLDYSNFFYVNPRANFRRSLIRDFEGNNATRGFVVDRFDLGITTGFQFGPQYGVFGVGILREWGESNQRIGTGQEKSEINQGAYIGELDIDQIDNFAFPKSGLLIDGKLFLYRKEFGTEEEYDKLTAGALFAKTFSRHTFLLGAQIGSSLGTNLPYFDRNFLGGFLRLTGYLPNQLNGKYSGLASIVYYLRLKQFGSRLFEAFYLGASIETGNVWEDPDDIINELILAGSIWIGMDTLMGPLYIGYGLAEGAVNSVFLKLGRAF
jgi:NTE family protein